jgi:conjugal transfer pilus assembly protein TraU
VIALSSPSMRRLIAGLAMLLAFVVTPMAAAQAPPVADARAAAVSCRGHFVNPITDTCWGCLLPISLGAIPIIHGVRPDSPNPASPICVCPAPPPLFLKIGLSIGFWEPVRLADSTRKSWCFPSLGGIRLPVPFGFGSGDASRSKGGGGEGDKTAQYQVHWYVYPLMYWLELLTDFLCLETASFDIAYVTELDPLWRDDELAAVIEPEALIFANPIALAACAADCVAASTYLPLQPMFWCAGCRGSMYPMTGNTFGTTGDVDGSLLAVEKFAYKMHREGLAWATRGSAALCAKYPAPIIDKLQYRFQLTNPVPNVIGPFTCPLAGATTQTYEFGKEVPVIGEDFGYLIWRKRNCCAGL